jgi:hypothetical protein
MKYKLLGKSGLRVSQAALGAMTFGNDWGWGPRGTKRKQFMRPTARQVDTSLTQPISTPTVRAKDSWVSSFTAIARASFYPRSTPTLRRATIRTRRAITARA